MLGKLFTTTALMLTIIGQVNAACLPAELCGKISGLTDVPLGTWGGTGDLTSNYELCVFVQNDNDSVYRIRGTGTGAGNAYIVSSGANDISVSIGWNQDGEASYFDLFANSLLSISNPNTADENCTVGGDSAQVKITIDEANMEYATAGTYTGTINIYTSPD